MNKKKVLILYDYFDPAYKAGGPIRSLVNLIHTLENQFEFFVLTTNQDHDGTLLDVKANEWQRYAKCSNVLYLDAKNRTLANMRKIIRAVNPDVVYLNGIFSWLFVVCPLLILRNQQEMKIVIAPRGMLQQGALQLKPIKKGLYLWILRHFLLKKARVSWQATDAQEALDINHFAPEATISSAANIPALDLSIDLNTEKKFDFVSISLLTPKKNHLHFIRALKRMTKYSSFTYHIYGPVSDQHYFQALKQEISNAQGSIEYKGILHPSKVGEVLRRYRFYVLPSLGENFGHSIFEAFNQGIPVIISDQTPWRDLEVKKAGWDVPLGKAGALHKVIEEAIEMDEETYRQYQQGARQLAEDYIKEQNFEQAYLHLFC